MSWLLRQSQVGYLRKVFDSRDFCKVYDIANWNRTFFCRTTAKLIGNLSGVVH